MELRSEIQMPLTLDPDPDDKAQFKTVAIYEDGSTGRRAKRFYDKLILEFEDECDFSLQLWSFQVLAIPELRKLGDRICSPGKLCYPFIARQSRASCRYL
jgi:hypothetical protein